MTIHLRLSLLLVLCAAISVKAAERTSILGIASGAVLLSSTGEYSGGWMALNLFDGTAQRGWCSPENRPLPHTFIVELPQRYHLKTMVLDNSGAQEAGYPGISARSVELWGSSLSSDNGYKKIATLEAAQGARKEFPLPAGAEANWLKLVVVSNWGHKQFTELMEVEAYGTPVGSAPERPPLSGAYDTNYGPLQLTRDGNRITGCYYGGNGQIAGATDGRTINVEWRQGDGSTHGTALMTLSSRGDFLNGVWYQNGVLEGSWFGTRNRKSGKLCDDASHNTLSQQLNRLSAHGYGSSRPVADNATPQGRALNRRVEIVAQN